MKFFKTVFSYKPTSVTKKSAIGKKYQAWLLKPSTERRERIEKKREFVCPYCGGREFSINQEGKVVCTTCGTVFEEFETDFMYFESTSFEEKLNYYDYFDTVIYVIIRDSGVITDKDEIDFLKKEVFHNFYKIVNSGVKCSIPMYFLLSFLVTFLERRRTVDEALLTYIVDAVLRSKIWVKVLNHSFSTSEIVDPSTSEVKVGNIKKCLEEVLTRFGKKHYLTLVQF